MWDKHHPVAEVLQAMEESPRYPLAVPLAKRQQLATTVAEQATRRLEAVGMLRTEAVMGAFICRDPVR